LLFPVGEDANSGTGKGQLVFSKVLNEAASFSLDTHAWPAGVFQVDIRPDQGPRIVQKLAIIR